MQDEFDINININTPTTTYGQPTNLTEQIITPMNFSPGMNFSNMTYNDLVKYQRENEIQYRGNRPQSPLQRIFTDLFGLFLFYVVTFMACNFLQKYFRDKKSKFTNLIWGPYYAITGAPIITWIQDEIFGKEHRPNNYAECMMNAQEAYEECESGFFDPGCSTSFTVDKDYCRDTFPNPDRTQDIANCNQVNTDTYQTCLDKLGEPYGATTCLAPFSEISQLCKIVDYTGNDPISRYAQCIDDAPSNDLDAVMECISDFQNEENNAPVYY